MEEGDVFLHIQNADKISGLPQDISNHILSRLPIRDAVRTSVLSSKWRFAWSKIPTITFTEECRLRFEEPPSSSRLLHIVDKVLLLHDGSIQSFKVSEFISSYNSDVGRWILFLSRKGIEVLELKFLKEVNDDKLVTSCLFSCKELRVLRLHYCALDVRSSFQGFKFLHSLDLKGVNLPEDAINNLLPICPRLRSLELEYDNNLRCLNINSPMLKYLRIRGAFEDLILCKCSLLENADIFLPNLVYDFQKDRLANTCNLEKILGSLSSLVKLGIKEHFLKFLALGIVEDRLQKLFENLKVLFLTVNFQDIKQIATALCIFRSSPNLQKIDIEATWLPKVENEKNNGEVLKECVFNRLKQINMNSFHGEQPEMEFLKFLLGNAPALETVSLTIAEDRKNTEGNILKSLISFQRASVSLKKFAVD